MQITRRTILAGLAATAASPALAQTALDAFALGVAPDAGDQSAPLQDALLRAAAEGRPLFLPAGTYLVTNLQLPSDLVLEGVPGATILAASGSEPVARISGNTDVTLRGIGFANGAGGPTGEDRGLLEIEASDHISLVHCGFSGSPSNGLAVRDAAVRIESCDFTRHALAGLYSIDSRGLVVSGNSVTDCGNAGMLIWASEPRRDGSILTGNHIARIGFTNGGNGQNGNGINVFRAAEVIISDNHIADCAFTAVRLNASRDCQVSGNLCMNSGEVAIFSEFEFSGSVIADNIIDGAAQGISVTNMLEGGQLAVCSGNIVRNISRTSAVNPDTRGVGIYAEAETVISGNSVQSVAGIAIAAGFGTYLRNVTITGNVIYVADYGIAISVVDNPAPGPVSITGNSISEAELGAIIGMAWDDVVEPDLAANAANYPHVLVANNQVTTFGS